MIPSNNKTKQKPNMALNIKPLGDRVLVEPVEEKETKKGGKDEGPIIDAEVVDDKNK